MARSDRAHGVVAEVSARVAGNKPGSGFYAGVTNEALIGDIQKVAKTNPAVAHHGSVPA